MSHSASEVIEKLVSGGSLQVKVKKVSETAILPTKATEGSAGFDLYADIDKEALIHPHDTLLLSTGLAFEIPKGYFGAIYPRSGISSKRGVRLANCVGVIDSDYRGVVGLPMHNDCDSSRYVKPHERVAQIIFQKYDEVELIETNELSETDRGTGGFGSTGE